MAIKKSNISDYQLAKIIEFHGMTRNDRKESENVHYYANDNYTIEILVIYDDVGINREIYINESIK